MTLSSEQIHASGAAKSGIDRRTLVRSAAWSVPVIAAATAIPLAAASNAPKPEDQAVIRALVGGTIAADGVNGTADGTFATSGVSITNVVGEFSTGTLTAKYVMQGPWNTASITKPDGTPFVLNETIVHGGTTWTVELIDSDGSNVWEIHFTGLAVTVTSDTVVSIPPAVYSGTFTPGAPTTRNPVAGQVAVAAEAVNRGVAVSNASGYPA